MNGYIKKQALMDYCSNQVTRTIDLNDIARFPVSEVYSKDEVIAMLRFLWDDIDDLDSITCDHVLSSQVKEIIEKGIEILKGEQHES